MWPFNRTKKPKPRVKVIMLSCEQTMEIAVLLDELYACDHMRRHAANARLWSKIKEVAPAKTHLADWVGADRFSTMYNADNSNYTATNYTITFTEILK